MSGQRCYFAPSEREGDQDQKMGGEKRHETTSLRSTSGRRDSTSPAVAGSQTQHQAKAVNVGCMSGIFHLISKYHTRRKFLTFAKKQEKEAPSTPKPETTTTTTTTATTTITITCKPRDRHDSPEPTTVKSSLDQAPRSPAIPPEIRTPGSANSPRVVARLMGIDSTPSSPPPPAPETTAAEKRRKLLGALEKCDEDLKALKKIIDTVRASQTPPRAAVKAAEKWADEEAEKAGDEPSPVSVLDFYDHDHDQQKLLSRSSLAPLTGQYSKRTRNGGQKQKVMKMLKPRGEEYNSTFYFPNKPTPPSSSVVDFITLRSIFLPTKTRPPLITNAKSPGSSTLTWSKVVVETVEEVCRDVECGQRSEIGSIGLLIQDFIFNDLVEELTKEIVIMIMRKRSMSFDYVFGFSRVRPVVSLSKRKLCL